MSTRAPSGRATSRATILFNERYEYSARWDGDAQAKKDAAAAKRTATNLKTAVKSFEALLEPEQLASMVAAAAAMRELASDLDQVCRLANKRKAEYTAAEEAKRKGNAGLSYLSSKLTRWPLTRPSPARCGAWACRDSRRARPR